jgi:hypothetical protein
VWIGLVIAVVSSHSPQHPSLNEARFNAVVEGAEIALRFVDDRLHQLRP